MRFKKQVITLFVVAAVAIAGFLGLNQVIGGGDGGVYIAPNSSNQIAIGTVAGGGTNYIDGEHELVTPQSGN